MKLLLTGAPRTGKSGLVRRLAAAFPGNAGGFVVAEVKGPDQRRCGFDLCSVWSRPGGELQVTDRAPLARADAPGALRFGRYAIDPTGIALGVAAIDAAMHESALVIMDEIGPLQTVDPAFRDAVLRCLDGPCRLLGTVSLQAADPFLERVRVRPGVRVVEVTRANREHLFSGLLPWVLGKF